MGRAHGVTEADLQALAEGTVEGLSPGERAAMAYAVAMTQTRVGVDDALFAALREAWSPPQIVELTAAIAWENYRARFNHALAIGAEGFSEGAFCPLPEPLPAIAPSPGA